MPTQFDVRTLEQWHMVLIGLVRVKAIYQTDPRVPKWSDEAGFDVMSFFVHCHHLEDYLREFDGLDSRSFAKADPNLQLCRDLVVNIKHAVMKQTAWSPGGSDAVASSGIALELNDGEPPRAHHGFQISWGGTNMDALVLADQCVTAWVRFGLPLHSQPPQGRVGMATGISLLRD